MRIRGVCHHQELRVRAKRIELLMHFIPFCIARHQLDSLASSLVKTPPVALVDGASPRRLAQKKHDKARGLLSEALDAAIEDFVQGQAEDQRARFAGAKWGEVLRFFSGTLAIVGGLNHNTGKRHFTIKLTLMEALVAALLPPEREKEFDEFCFDLLFQKYGLILDPASANAADLEREIDSGEFRANKLQLGAIYAASGCSRSTPTQPDL